MAAASGIVRGPATGRGKPVIVSPTQVHVAPDPLLDEANALRDENAALRRELQATRDVLRTTSELFLAAQGAAKVERGTLRLPASDEPDADA